MAQAYKEAFMQNRTKSKDPTVRNPQGKKKAGIQSSAQSRSEDIMGPRDQKCGPEKVCKTKKGKKPKKSIRAFFMRKEERRMFCSR